MNIHGDKIILRAINEDDIELLYEWANDPEIWYNLGGWHFPSSMEFIKEYHRKNDPINQRFAIVSYQEGLIGTTSLTEMDWKNRHAFHGIMIGNKDSRGKGYGADVIKTIMKYAFNELNLERLETTIIEYNAPSLNLYKKLGWKREGCQKKWYFRKGRYWDRILLGILREDFF